MEIIAVIGLLAAIMGLVVVNVGNIFEGGREEVAKTFVEGSVQSPLMAYRMNVGTYPTTEEGLQALLVAPQGKADRWKGPYMTKQPVDPWGRPYQYRYPGVKNTGGYDVWSLGPDGVEGPDDIGNWAKSPGQ